MKVLLITKFSPAFDGLPDPLADIPAEGMAAMGKYMDEMIEAGVLLSADGIKPTKFGKRVDFNGTKRTITDGPFTESKELISGFFMLEVASMDEAMSWAQRFPNHYRTEWRIEVRPLWEPADVSPQMAADWAEREAKGAAKQAAKATGKK